jgi:FtsP/CotA-like multicopper oxidase with cupredoxin domain
MGLKFRKNIMKRKTILVITITLLLAMLVFGACASGTPSQSAASRQQGGTATVRQIDAMSMDEIVSLLGLRGPPARGNTGNSLQDDIAWMNSWRSVRGSAINFLMNNPPTLHVLFILL